MMMHTLLAAIALTVAQSPATWTDIAARLDAGAASSDAAVLKTAMTDAEKLADATGLDRERELALLGAAYGGWRLAAGPGGAPGEAPALVERRREGPPG